MGLCTLSQVKTRLSIPDSESGYDALLTGIIAGVSEQMAGSAGAGRPLEQGSFVHAINVLDAQAAAIWLPVWPIVDVDEVLERPAGLVGTWTDATELTEDDEFSWNAESGLLVRVAGYWPTGLQSVRVSYDAGYVAAGGTPQTGEFAMPSDIIEAAVQQCVHVYAKRDNPGIGGGGAGGANAYYPAIGIEPARDPIRSTRRRWPFR